MNAALSIFPHCVMAAWCCCVGNSARAMSSSGGTMSTLVLPVAPLSRGSPTALPFPIFSRTSHEQQLQALLHFLIDHLKLFLIGCVPIRSDGGERQLRPLLPDPRRQFAMQCPSCGAVTETSDCCTESGLMLTGGQDGSEDQSGSPRIAMDIAMESDGVSSENLPRPKKASTLIEFPGVPRSSLPEWRKEQAFS